LHLIGKIEWHDQTLELCIDIFTAPRKRPPLWIGEQFKLLQSVPTVLTEDPMQVAPDFDSSEWPSLKLDDPMSKDWKKAISVFGTRIYSRFLDAADVLVSLDEKSRSRNGDSVLPFWRSTVLLSKRWVLSRKG
jgi:hypothetical protein